MTTKRRPKTGIAFLALAAVLGFVAAHVFTNPGESEEAYLVSFFCTIFAVLSIGFALAFFFPPGAIKPGRSPVTPRPTSADPDDPRCLDER